MPLFIGEYMTCILYRKTEQGDIVEERCEAVDVAHNLSLDCYRTSKEAFEQDDLESKDFEELKQIAESKGIDVGKKKSAGLIKAIREL